VGANINSNKIFEIMTPEEYVFSRIGMALISAQRVEFITGELVKYLIDFDEDLYGITTPEFLSNSPSAQQLRKQTLGQIFKLLKLNPKWVITDVLDDYLKKRNILAHTFWKDYLHSKTDVQCKLAVEFCNDFGKASTKLESFFKGFIFFLSLKHVKDRDRIGENLKPWGQDFDYFMLSLRQDKL
jgi:hypothetical protein